jgi:hypothetical protein
MEVAKVLNWWYKGLISDNELAGLVAKYLLK